MKILNIMCTGGLGGIETLANNINLYSKDENIWYFVLDGGEITNALKDSGSKVYVDKKQFFKSYKVMKKICESGIDIVALHHNFWMGNLLFCMLKRKYKDIKFVKFVHSAYDKRYMAPNMLKYILIKITTKMSLRMADKIIAVSNYIKKDIIRFYEKVKQKIVVIYNGISPKYYDDQYYNKKLDNNIVYIGRVVPGKGLDLLLESLKKIGNEVKFRLTIVGDGSELDKLKVYVKENNLKNIDFVGRQQDITKYLDEAKIFVYPSVCNEAFGISIVEGMARGCIPVVFGTGGIPEIVNEKNGFITELISSDSLCELIKNALKSDIKPKTETEEAKKFSILNTIKELKNEYGHLKKME